MFLADVMSWLNRQPALDTDKGQVLGDNDPAVIEEDMVVGTQAVDVVRFIGSIVGCSERPDVSRLCVGSSEAL